MWEIIYVSLWVQQNDAVLLVLNSIPNINVHGRQKESTGRVLVPGHLYTVFVACTLLHIMGQILSASLLQFHCFTCTDVTESTWPNLFFFLLFFNMLLCLGAHYSIEIQRSITSNYRSPFQVYTAPLQRGLAGSPFTLKSKTLHLSTMGSDVFVRAH